MISVSSSISPKVYSGNFKCLILWSNLSEDKIQSAAYSYVDKSATESDLKKLISQLSLAYSALIFDRIEKTVTFIVGHRNIFPIFFSKTSGSLEVSDRLPLSTMSQMLDNLDSDGFADFIARMIVTGPYELSCHTETFDKRWQAVPPGQRLVFDKNNKQIKSDVIDDVYEGICFGLPSPLIAADEFRNAIDAHITRLSINNSISSEFSGGIDSGIVRSRCIRMIPEKYVGAITCNFPYVEFQREGQMQKSILSHLPGAVNQIPHRDFLPFSGIEQIPRHHQPTVATTSWGTFSNSALAAKKMGATILLNGHGGDTLFRWHPQRKINYKLPEDILAWLTKRVSREVADRADTIATYLNSHQNNIIGGLWHPGMFDPYQPHNLLQSGKSGILYSSGLVCRETLRKGARFWMTNPPLETGLQKSAARFVFKNDLPESVWVRPGKVDHLGIVFRGAISAAMPILRATSRSSSILDELGANSDYFTKSAKRAVAGLESDNMMFSLLLSIVLWADQLRSTTHQEACEFTYTHKF